MAWRAFVGSWSDLDWTRVDQTFEHRGEAVAVLLAQLALFRHDTCPDCKADAAAETERLKAASAAGWEGFVDGDDYVLTRVHAEA